MLQICIFLLVVGILALALEVIMPGYDGFIGGVVGVLSLITASILAVMFVPGGWWVVAVSAGVLVVCAYLAQLYIRRGQLHGKVVLTEALAEDLPRLDLSGLVGKEGRAVTRLGPYGDADFNGTKVTVTTGGVQMLPAGTRVKVVEANDQRVLVQALHAN